MCWISSSAVSREARSFATYSRCAEQYFDCIPWADVQGPRNDQMSSPTPYVVFGLVLKDVMPSLMLDGGAIKPDLLLRCRRTKRVGAGTTSPFLSFEEQQGADAAICTSNSCIKFAYPPTAVGRPCKSRTRFGKAHRLEHKGSMTKMKVQTPQRTHTNCTEFAHRCIGECGAG